MVLMHDPFGVYTLEESIWIGRELEKLDYYWLEHPMVETRIEAYRRLTRELDDRDPGARARPGRAVHARRVGAAGRGRHAAHRRELRRHHRLLEADQPLPAARAQVRAALRRPAHVQLLGAAPEATCLYYERGLLRPGVDDPLAAPYLNSLPDPLDGDGNVLVSQQPDSAST